MRASSSDWTAPVLLTMASRGEGVPELVERIEEHLDYLRAGDGLGRRRRQRIEKRLHDLIGNHLWREFHGRVPDERWQRNVDALMEHRITPHEAARQLARRG
jgi:LAO/AO transport system kinase